MDKERVKAFTDKVFADMAGAMSCGLAYVGVKTGLFRALAGKAAATLDEVVATTGLQRRYVDEWLRGMACAGYLEYEPQASTYRLPDEHAFLLACEGTDHDASGLYLFAPVLLRVAPEVATAFERGGGVPFEAYGPDGVEAIEAVNRGQYEQRFASYWLEALPDVVAKLEAGARVLDVGCGTGCVVLTLADAFPRSTFVGVDRDAESIRRAEAATTERELGEQVRFVRGSVSAVGAAQPFDLVTLCDALHDLAAPVATLRAIRALLAPDGVLFVVEPKVADRLEDNFHSVGAMYYGFSVFHCMTQSLAEGGPGLGTCLGPARAKALLNEAGFGRFDVLDLKSRVLAFYAVRP